MKKYKQAIAWLVMTSVLMTFTLPVTPAYAFSLSNLLGQTTGDAGSAGASGVSTGKGVVDILLGLFLGKVLGNASSGSAVVTDQATSSNSGSNSDLAKEFVGFYAEWWGEDTSSYNSMVQNTDVIKTIAPFWATMQADGTLTDRGGNDHISVVNTAHQNNMTVLLLVNNAKQDDAAPVHNVLANPALRTKAIDNFEAYIKKYNLDGINVDFEMVPAADRDNLTAFMRELYARLKPQGYIVSIDVFPKQNEDNDAAAAYDYAELAKYADKIMIMTYDNHGTWSGPGPIADIRWVENNLKYALNFIPKDKLYLGIAAYGYDWSKQGVQSLEYDAIMDLTQRYGKTVQWDDTAKSPHFSYTANDGTAHTVWFENSESLKHKLALITQYDIAGAAMWKLGEEDPAVWPVLRDKFRK